MTFQKFLDSTESNQPHFLLFGNPVSHSISPLMHNLALTHHGIQAKYIAVEATISDLASIATHLNNPSFLGANITIPFKEDFIPLIDELTVTAESVGAINTILKRKERLIGDNTDVFGFSVPINEIEDPDTDRAIIFGSGGATKAIIQALNDFGFEEVYIVSRKTNLQPHQENVIVCTYDEWQHYAEDCSLFINATPLGMVPNIDQSPVKDSEIEFLTRALCYDIVYNPRETKFLKQAKKVGAITIGGIDMLIHQGAEAFFKWTGKRFPVGLIKMKLDEHFSI